MTCETIGLSTSLWETSLELPPRQDADVVNVLDEGTPDEWIYRHKEMVRLTGRHPFNAEPRLQELQKAGWITPPSLHVVRNHGSVPKLSWAEHKLKITGVPKPCELSMDQLASGEWGEVATFPVTFICAGNRRKEQNMTKKTVGFNWGCAAVGNSIWTGVRLSDLLNHLGITKASKEHRYVHFESPEGELPQGKTGSYGTSIDIGWALDRERDVLLAFKQNGEFLTPDHGFPLRTLLPGCIGGRMIKWLCTMHVSDKPSENHYHYFDNRVLPPHVDAELATKEGWWYKPDYIINHTNINSAMFEPRHNSYCYIEEPKAPKTLKICGYAYTGGGQMIIRAEISLDSGASWELTDLTRPEDEIAAARGTDKHWCWAWWETEVEISRLLKAREICCRAFDSNQNSQPAQLTWNVMGMLNNPIFRIKIHHIEHNDAKAIWFEHPTMPGSEAGGWMTEDAGVFVESTATEAAAGATGVGKDRLVAAMWKDYGAPAGVPATQTSVPEVSRQELSVLKAGVAGKLVTSTEEWLTKGIPMEEVLKHNDEKSSWFVVKNRVYDGTPFLERHPGGASSILLVAGQEATEDFEAVHSKKAWEDLEDYFIGVLADSTQDSSSTDFEEQGPFESLIQDLDLEAYLDALKKEDLDLESLPFVKPEDLRAIGLSLGKAIKLIKRAQMLSGTAPVESVAAASQVTSLQLQTKDTPTQEVVSLDQKRWQKLELVEKIVVSHDTRIFRFGLQSHDMRLGLPTGMHVLLRAKVNGSFVMRPYTPMTDDATLGHVDFLVKVYFAGVHPQFPDGGKLSQHLESMKLGDFIEVKGPIGEFIYSSHGNFTWHNKPRTCERISLIAGGTGLTPCYQIINAVLRQTDNVKLTLLYANRSPADILARETLEKLASEHPDQFKLHYTVDKLSEGDVDWKYNVGFITKDMLKACIFLPGSGSIVAMCGPPIMIEKACIPNLKELGFADENLFCF
jgi:nitrate reductase (NAD(P)H)